ncbi:putative membrane protein [Limimaricola soesokkakensis]|uniref:Putative membrane protein n=1 Tax=Limimaricola soesokkakensis TaxID=1343159 RepID=A0A1X6Z9M1_9RHOB|nr:DUF2243 domain-containing protein [Limimaricola soesokkakensis]PSK86510.1 putative membrane protein [Limimaricola soesokkakensis]SLN44818.1 hypothetical protein LOS8367_01955 [Limimaricola soesokkakensis]
MPSRHWIGYGSLLGLALGGFFDGILLHQILQWHHLLSLVPGIDDMRLQILWDGYFHLLMYVLAAVALWGLWRAHGRGSGVPGAQLVGAMLLGFGGWHVLDSVLSHWVLGIHRIKLDSPNPMLWDLMWFFVFGLAPMAAGWVVMKRGGPGSGRSVAAMLALTATTAGAGVWSMRPSPDQPLTAVVFRPGVEALSVRNAIDELDAKLVWADPAMGVVILDVAPENRWGFYRRGAMLVSGSGVPAGCFSWSTA